MCRLCAEQPVSIQGRLLDDKQLESLPTKVNQHARSQYAEVRAGPDMMRAV